MTTTSRLPLSALRVLDLTEDAGEWSGRILADLGAEVIRIEPPGGSPGRRDQVGFALPLGFKDVKLVLQAAEARTVPMPIASLLHDRMLSALARGYEKKDWSVLGRVAAEDAGLARAQHA